MSPRQEQTDERSGRTRQKNRTRRALLNAALELIRAGGNPTVAEVAEAAEISRATAYRYFPTHGMLLAEVALHTAGGPLVPDEEPDPSLSVPEAVASLVRRVGDWAFENQTALRTLLRLSLDPTTGIVRPGHRVEWIEDVLRPARDQIDAETYDRLATSLTLLLGIDPVVALTDIAEASREEALDTLTWSAQRLVEAALAEGKAARRKASKQAAPAA
jgi:AcrR family transcriptional regulator